MEGHRVVGDLPDDAWRDWAASAKFGWTDDQIDNASAIRLDWRLAIDSVVEEVKAKAQRRAQESDGRR
jgi:hypothetical protein